MTIKEEVKKLIKEHINEEEFEECPYCKAIAYLKHGNSDMFCFNCTFVHAKWLSLTLEEQMELHSGYERAGKRIE